MFKLPFIPVSLITSNAMAEVSFKINEEPAALGCTAVMSPERPIP